jgi:adenine/guanine phosphoribosyltransferase-like PRPP-binding protein
VGARTYSVEIGTQRVDLPVVSLNDQLALALLITVDMGVEFMSQAGAELADVLKSYNVEIVATVATMGIPLVVEVTRHLGLDQYVILHKTPKIHLADAVAEPVRSITTDADQRLLFDRARIDDVVNRRVAIVDDVISTGASTSAALRLLRGVGAARRTRRRRKTGSSVRFNSRLSPRRVGRTRRRLDWLVLRARRQYFTHRCWSNPVARNNETI